MNDSCSVAIRLVLPFREPERHRLRSSEPDRGEVPRLPVRAVELVVVDRRVVLDRECVGAGLQRLQGFAL